LTDNEQIHKLKQEIEHLQMRLQEMEETMASVCGGTADAIIVSTIDGDKVFTLKTEEQPYRLFVENMPLGAVLLSEDGMVLYCNKAFADMVKETPEVVVGRKIQVYISQNCVGDINGVLKKSSQENNPQQCSLSIQTKDGSLNSQVFVNQIQQDSFKGACLVFAKLPLNM
jgi:two-component system CheB/CheR fusion protein